LKEELLLLIKLQENDLGLVRLSAKKKILPENLQKLDREFDVYKDTVGKSKVKYDELKARHSENEGKIKKLNEGINKTKERMLDVKNNKEYQAMLREIEIAEHSRSELETEIITLLDELDRISVLVKEDEAKLKRFQSEYEREKKAIENELESIDADILKLEKERMEIQNRIPSELLAKYEKIRKRGNGIGVTSVWKSVCNGCHMNIPPQLYNELQSTNDLLICPNCNRIIYFQEMGKTA